MLLSKNLLRIASLLLAAIFTSLHTVSAEVHIGLADFEGNWASADNALGGPARSNLRWETTLGGQFYEVKYSISRPNAQSLLPVYAGQGLYQQNADGSFSAVWADSQGDMLPISARIIGNALVANWGDTISDKRGRTRYELRDSQTLIVTDHIYENNEWIQFNHLEFSKMAAPTSQVKRHVTGIGGLFFRGKDPKKLSDWYDNHFQINPPPSGYDQEPWQQDSGYTVFGAFEEDTDYFGNAEKQWMINFRVNDLDGLINALRTADIEVSNPEQHPQGRFARLVDPEGNPIELWEPTE